MFNADLELKDRIAKYSTIDPERVFGDDAAIDNCLEFLDQDFLGEDALSHGYDLYRDVNQFSEDYKFQDKPMRSPLMSFLQMI